MRRWRPKRAMAVAGVVVGVVVAFLVMGTFSESPAHSYNTRFEPCWSAAALGALGARSTFAPSFCRAPAGSVTGLGHVVKVYPESLSPGRELVILETAEVPGRGEEGLAYVVNVTPPPDSCVSPLGGPWWQLAYLNLISMSCPRGFTYQPGP